MTGDLKERAPQDASRIGLTEEWEVRYWTKALGVTGAASRPRPSVSSHLLSTALRLGPVWRLILPRSVRTRTFPTRGF
jgi:hypothetical protein